MSGAGGDYLQTAGRPLSGATNKFLPDIRNPNPATALANSPAHQSLSSGSTSTNRPAASTSSYPSHVGTMPLNASAAAAEVASRTKAAAAAAQQGRPDSAPRPLASSPSSSRILGSSGSGTRTPQSLSRMATEANMSALPPRRAQTFSIHDFQILNTLGTGSFGRVHLVRLKSNGKHYAMKVLRKSEIVKLKQVEHTINEKHILEKLEFPFLVNLLGTFQDANNLYLVLEYVQGGELFSYLRKSGRFPNHVARFYAAEVVTAFEYLHTRDIVYRDLKPENLLIDHLGHIKITDFGFAKVVPDVTWTLCGTPDYLAPEIIQNKGHGKAADWWALGVLIFEMLAGYPPFFDEDHFKLYEKILACKLRFPAHIDPLAKDLIKRLLTPDLSKRFGNLRAGAEDIKRHKWFAGVDWGKLVALHIQAPYVPKVAHEGDTSNFDQYPEDHEPYGVGGADPYRDKFKDF